MRKTLAFLAIMVCAVSALAAESAGTAPAANEAELSYYDIPTDKNPLISRAAVRAASYSNRPRAIKADPPGVRGQGRYFLANLGGAQIGMLLSQGQGGVLFADTNLNGTLADESALPRSAGDSSIAIFGPVDIGSGEAKFAIRVMVMGGTRATVLPAGFVAGEVTLGNRKHNVAVLDANFDGRYEGVISAESRVDLFAIDVDGDDSINGDFLSSGELMPLPRLVRVGRTYYELAVEPDGSSLTLTETTPAMGVLAFSSGHAEVSVWSDAGWHLLEQSAREWNVPAGTYWVTGMTLRGRDSSGQQWLARAVGNMDKLHGIEVAEGETTAVEAGTPLVVKTTVADMQGGDKSIGFDVYGQAGEKYDVGILVEGMPTPAPKFEIVDEEGTVLVSGSFKYG